MVGAAAVVAGKAVARSNKKGSVFGKNEDSEENGKKKNKKKKVASHAFSGAEKYDHDGCVLRKARLK